MKQKENERVQRLKYRDKNNKDEESGQNESMYNIINTLYYTFRQKEGWRVYQSKYSDKNNKDKETDSGELRDILSCYLLENLF